MNIIKTPAYFLAICGIFLACNPEIPTQTPAAQNNPASVEEASVDILHELAEEIHHLREDLEESHSREDDSSIKQDLHELQMRLMQVSEQINGGAEPGSSLNQLSESHIKRMAFEVLKHEEGTQIMPLLQQIQIHRTSEDYIEVEIPFKNRGEPNAIYIGWVSCQTQPELNCTLESIES